MRKRGLMGPVPYDQREARRKRSGPIFGNAAAASHQLHKQSRPAIMPSGPALARLPRVVRFYIVPK